MAKIKSETVIVEIAYSKAERAAIYWAASTMATLSRLQIRSEHDALASVSEISDYRDRRWEIDFALTKAIGAGETDALLKLHQASSDYSTDI